MLQGDARGGGPLECLSLAYRIFFPTPSRYCVRYDGRVAARLTARDLTDQHSPLSMRGQHKRRVRVFL